MEKGRLFLVDSHPVFVAGIAALIKPECEWTFAGGEGDRERAIEAVRRLQPDIVLLELDLGQTSGLDLIEPILTASPRTRICCLTTYEDPSHVRAALLRGATGYASKRDDLETLSEAVRSVARGKRFISPTLHQSIVEGFLERTDDSGPNRGGRDEQLVRLSGREREVLSLIARGHDYKTVGAELAISVRTVEAHRARIARKLDLDTKAALIRYALDNGIT